jgi:TPR repeat protein
VASFRNHEIVKIDADGNQTVFSSGGSLNAPNGLAFDPSGNLYVADTYSTKRFVDAKDYIRALPPLQKAADAGNGDAMNQLGELYYHGRGVDHDYTRAREWYEKGRD